MSSKHPTVDDVDDVDDLDDVLQEFNDDVAVQKPNPIAGSSGRLRHNTTVEAPQIPFGQRPPGPSGLDAANSDELGAPFARELAKEMEEYLLRAFIGANPSASGGEIPAGDGEEGLETKMEDFMREIGIDPSTFPSDGTIPGEDNGEREPEKTREAEEMFKRLWEAMNVLGDSGQGPEIGGTKTGPSGVDGSTSQGPTTKKGHGFQDVLRPVIDKMKESEESNAQGPKGGFSEEALAPGNLEELMASFSNLGPGTENEEELSGFLENMMKQLLSKEVLYEPLKELSDKFPGYLASPPSPINSADRQRYEKQLVLINKILAIFDAPDFRDDNPETHKVLVELMSEVQSYGSPPEELMGPLPPGLGLGTDGAPGCVIA